MKDFRYLEGVTTLKLDTEACVGCGECESVCPHAVFKINGKKAEIVDLDGCMEWWRMRPKLCSRRHPGHPGSRLRILYHPDLDKGEGNSKLLR